MASNKQLFANVSVKLTLCALMSFLLFLIIGQNLIVYIYMSRMELTLAENSSLHQELSQYSTIIMAAMFLTIAFASVIIIAIHHLSTKFFTTLLAKVAAFSKTDDTISLSHCSNEFYYIANFIDCIQDRTKEIETDTKIESDRILQVRTQELVNVNDCLVKEINERKRMEKAVRIKLCLSCKKRIVCAP